MAAGNQPTLASVNSQAGIVVIELRDAFQKVKFFNDYLSSQAGGGQAFLTGAQIGMGSADAATMVSTFANLAALYTQYTGGAQAPQLNYQQNSNLLWGGQ